ncbi:hypothetical protein ACFX2I_022367 [Malus domestica]
MKNDRSPPKAHSSRVLVFLEPLQSVPFKEKQASASDFRIDAAAFTTVSLSLHLLLLLTDNCATYFS